MSASRHRPKGASRPFGLVVFLLAMSPAQIGYQDLAALIARQPSVSERWRQHVLASPFGTIHAATFSFPRPVGTAIPEPLGYQLASFDPRSLDITGSIPRSRGIDPLDDSPPIVFPTVDRRLKGDLLVPRAPAPARDAPKSRPQPVKDRDYSRIAPPPSETALTGNRPKPDVVAPPSRQAFEQAQDAATRDAKTQDRTAPHIAADAAAPDIARLPDAPPAAPEMLTEDDVSGVESAAALVMPEHPAIQSARLFFGPDAVGAPDSSLRPWEPGEEPILEAPPRASPDPDIKLSALMPDRPMPSGPIADETEKETIAPKGEVTGEGRRPKTPAERLGLTGKLRAKHEKCLADAIYFESRGEPLKGQEAVAQVVMNRVFSGKYPDNVCGVVYQNSHRYLACQFTFACEGKKLVVDEPDMWEQAKRIAHDTLDGKLWVKEVGKSTHYHAYWVRPSWVNEMKRLYKFGVHTFYRPRAWGDGSDEPAWGAGAKPIAPQADASTSQPSVAAAKL
jgi:spore germination cell wall hydrolase CwlJ-like protein